MKLRINLQDLDFFGKGVALNYNKNATVRTSFGGIFSLACLVTIILFFREKVDLLLLSFNLFTNMFHLGNKLHR